MRNIIVGVFLAIGAPAMAADAALATYSLTDLDGRLIKNVLVPAPLEIAQRVELLAVQDMWVCDESIPPVCGPVTVPWSIREQAVIDGTADFSARVVYNGSQPGQPLWQFDKGYWRVLVRAGTKTARRYYHVDFGVSWSPPTEVTFTPGAHGCNSFVVHDQTPGHVFATMNEETCDPDGVVSIMRGATFLRENDQQSFTLLNLGGTPLECRPFAPITVLPSFRTGVMDVTRDGKPYINQGVYIFGTTP